MPDVRALYQDSILEHSKRPRNFGKLADADRSVECENPLCGDRIALYVKIVDGRIADIAFEGEGCAIAMASASMMGESIKDRSVAAAEALSQEFAELLQRGHAGEGALLAEAPSALGPLVAFAPVSEFPGRIECARLAWHALATALGPPDRG